ncbi:hypothetical protein F511_38648 [Dorcoceras hygrometricum]|uniref:Retrotransposon gag domain-containing protein n=1 Tax=Dorcoceras hygrometricum TaxID=472368 RepID=A0A2Z6ZYG8_9LAMI|nr:hypothetical protein F511_43751 [Dorcoceras hygrometricum]KZV50313.1 hypothetical protein F511_38648 [Dorcoceras hygrometricum]
MSPRKRDRVVRKVVGESRAPESDEDVAQQRVPLCRISGQTEAGVEEVWLEHMEELFDTIEFSEEKRLKLAVLQLREHERWWKGTSRVIHETGVLITWESLCAAFRREYTPESLRHRTLKLRAFKSHCENQHATINHIAPKIISARSNAASWSHDLIVKSELK